MDGLVHFSGGIASFVDLADGYRQDTEKKKTLFKVCTACTYCVHMYILDVYSPFMYICLRLLTYYVRN